MFRALRNDEYLWQSVCNNAGTQSLRQCIKDAFVRAYPREDVISRHFAQRLEACAELDKVKWLRLKNSEYNRGPQLEKMEAHTATSMLNRFVVVVGGWCNSSDNRIDVIDGEGLDGGTDQDPGGTPLPLVTLPAFTENTPTFRYGFSTTEYRGRLIVLGGCRGGGYSNDCNNCYFVDLRFHCAPPVNAAEAGAEMRQQGEEVLYLNRQFAAVSTCSGTTDLRGGSGVAGGGGGPREAPDADWQALLQTPSTRVQKVRSVR